MRVWCLTSGRVQSGDFGAYPYESCGYVRCRVLGVLRDHTGRLTRGSRTTSHGVPRVRGYARCTRVPAGPPESRPGLAPCPASPSSARRPGRLSDGPRTSGRKAHSGDSPTVPRSPAKPPCGDHRRVGALHAWPLLGESAGALSLLPVLRESPPAAAPNSARVAAPAQRRAPRPEGRGARVADRQAQGSSAWCGSTRKFPPRATRLSRPEGVASMRTTLSVMS